ncbi:MAG: prolipoprotein diacylglyceryl transferase [Candidatus Moranbacteria bacterium]|nr:prolipoprotein diacylglyceryl transferase [Candidatus Moranbacteria bacterium]
MGFWTDIPQHIDPVAFAVGSLSVRWYAVCFIGGYAALVASLFRRLKRLVPPIDADTIWDVAVYVFLGVLIGGRLGFALFYEPDLFLNPVSLVWQIDPETGFFSGIRGMSFFGALIGATIACYLFTKSRRIPFFRLTDFVVPSVPIALFFGRIGNFLNLELPGRLTTVPWGVYFPNAIDGAWELRHPSQLYEAVLEGIVLYVVLNVLKKRSLPTGMLSFIFLSGYAIMRFLAENYREPDPGSTMFFGWMTIGQAFSLVLLVVSVAAYILIVKRGVMCRKAADVLCRKDPS